MVAIQGLSEIRSTFGTLSTSFEGQGGDFMNCAWDFVDMANSGDPSQVIAQKGANWIMSFLNACVPNRGAESAADKAKNTAATTSAQVDALSTNTTLLNNKSIIEAAMNAQLSQLKDIESFLQDENNKLTEKQQQIKEKKEALEKLQQEYQAAETDDEKAKKLGEIQGICADLNTLQPEIDAIKTSMAEGQVRTEDVSQEITNSETQLTTVATQGQKDLTNNVRATVQAGEGVAEVPANATQDATELAAAEKMVTTSAIPVVGAVIGSDAAAIVADRTTAIGNDGADLAANVPTITNTVTTIGNAGVTLSGLVGDGTSFMNGLIASVGSIDFSTPLATVENVDVTTTADEMNEAAEKDLALLEENNEENAENVEDTESGEDTNATEQNPEGTSSTEQESNTTTEGEDTNPEQ